MRYQHRHPGRNRSPSLAGDAAPRTLIAWPCVSRTGYRQIPACADNRSRLASAELTLAVRVVRYGKCSAATGRTDRVERWRKTLHCITDGKRASEETQRDSNVTIKSLETPFPAGKADTRCLPDEQAPLVTQGTRASVVTESSASRTSPLSRIRVSTDGLRTKCLFLRKLGRDAHRSNLLIHARQRQACQANALFVHTLVKNQGWNTPFTYILLQYPALLPLFLVTHIDLFSFISKR